MTSLVGCSTPGSRRPLPQSERPLIVATGTNRHEWQKP
jgi:hypothetical protein